MKLITAIIRPHKLEDVREALDKLGIHGITISEVKGYGNQKGFVENYRGVQYEVNYHPKVEVKIAVAHDECVEGIVNAIVNAARSSEGGRAGDGKIFITPLEEVVRIRTGERGKEAI